MPFYHFEHSLLEPIRLSLGWPSFLTYDTSKRSGIVHTLWFFSFITVWHIYLLNTCLVCCVFKKVSLSSFSCLSVTDNPGVTSIEINFFTSLSKHFASRYGDNDRPLIYVFYKLIERVQRRSCMMWHFVSVTLFLVTDSRCWSRRPQSASHSLEGCSTSRSTNVSLLCLIGSAHTTNSCLRAVTSWGPPHHDCRGCVWCCVICVHRFERTTRLFFLQSHRLSLSIFMWN